jgi:hypothetical protein
MRKCLPVALLQPRKHTYTSINLLLLICVITCVIAVHFAIIFPPYIAAVGVRCAAHIPPLWRRSDATVSNSIHLNFIYIPKHKPIMSLKFECLLLNINMLYSIQDVGRSVGCSEWPMACSTQ